MIRVSEGEMPENKVKINFAIIAPLLYGGLTQSQIAEKGGVTKSTVSRALISIEKGRKIRRQTAGAIARGTGIKIEQLLKNGSGRKVSSRHSAAKSN